MTVGLILQWALVAVVVLVAAGYALLVLAPVAAKQRLGAKLGARAPSWLHKRLAGEGGCAQCPANAMTARRPPSPGGS